MSRRVFPNSSLLNPESVSARIAMAGELDPTFSPTIDTRPGWAYATATQTDGKILFGGGFKSVNGFATSGMVRLNADRSIDQSFVANIRGTVFAIAIQPDGKIVVGGAFISVDGTFRSSIARLNSNGSLDATFNPGTGVDNLIRDISIQSDGKIVVVGQFVVANDHFSLRIARFNSDGSIDKNFSSPLGAGNPPGPATFITGVEVLSDGKILIVGSLLIFGDSNRRFMLRLNGDGSPDGTFSAPNLNGNPWQLYVQTDGKIVIGGGFTTVNGTGRTRLARLNSDGTLDTGFNPGTGANSLVTFVSVRADGKVLVAGAFSSINGSARGGAALLNSDGSLDGSFAPTGATSGMVYGLTQFAGGYIANGTFAGFSGGDRATIAATSASGSVDESFNVSTVVVGSLRAILVQPDGRILVGGIFNNVNGLAAPNIARLNPNGTRDTSFDTTGVAAASVLRFVLQADGRILVIGSGLRIGNGPTTTMLRLNADGSPDSSFTLGAIENITIGTTAAVQPNGKILFAYATSNPPPNSAGLLRLNSDGSLDNSYTPSSLTFDEIAVLPDGSILAAGSFGFTIIGPGPPESYAGMMKFTSTGAIDPTFRAGVVAESQAFTDIRAMHVQADGKIIIGGRLYTQTSQTVPFGLLRLHATGSVDGTFQASTISSPLGQPSVNSFHVFPNGKIVGAGSFSNFGGIAKENIIRMEANGVPESSLNAGTDAPINTLTVDANGSLLIGGSFEAVNGTPRTLIARLLMEPVAQDRAPFDFDGDGKTDLSIFRPNGAEWWINRSSNGSTFAAQFGATTDRITPADFTGDGKADIAFFRPSSGEWYILRSEDFSFFAFPFGTNGDVPAPADYDGDGIADAAVFRPSNSTWFIRRSSGGTTIEGFGSTGDVPVVADYDGDGKADIAIYRPSLGQWWVKRSGSSVIAFTFGESTDKPVQGDYTGDGKSDVAFFRPSTGQWFILRSEDFSFYAVPFGTTGDIPSPGDYDGDGKFDTAVFRPSNVNWYVDRSTAGVLIQQFGATGDVPVPNAYVP